MLKINLEKYYFWIGPLIILIVWFIISGIGIVSKTLLPEVFETFEKIYELIGTGQIFSNLGPTIARTLVGFMIAVIIGVPAGVYLGARPKIYKMFEVVIEFFRSLPGTAMFPLFLLAFGIGDGSKIAISWFISFWVILVNSAYGSLYGSKIRLRVGESLKINNWQMFSRIIFMDALPQIFIGLRIGLSLSLIAVVVSEMFIGSNTGLGQKIYDSYLTYEISYLYAWLIITGFTGYVLNKIFTRLEKRIVHWVGK